MSGSRFFLSAALLALVASALAQQPPHEDGGALGAAICAHATADRWHFPHPYDCSRFIKCDVANGVTSIITCNPNLLYNAAAEVCDYAANVECKVIPEPSTTTTTRRPQSTSTTRRPQSTTTTRRPQSTTTTRRPQSTTTTTTAAPPPPTDFWSLCRYSKPDDYHVPHPTDITKFFKCDWSVRVAYEFDCPSGLIYNAFIRVCDYP